MLSFILGAPASGKTSEIIDRINSDISNSKNVLLLVPEQDALNAERRIIDSQSSTPDLFNLEVANFRRLSNIVFRTMGGLCYNYIENGGQAVIMWRALSELSESLHTYKTGESTDIGLVSSLISLYSQLADYNIRPNDLETATEKLPETLKHKAEDLTTVYHRYNDLISGNFDSSKDDLKKVASLIRDYKVLADTKVYIDSFSGFTPAELDVIKALISVDCDITVSLCIDRERSTELFGNLQDIKDILTGYAKESGIEVCKDHFCSVERDAEFSHFAKYIFDSEIKCEYHEETKNITLTEAPDVYSECELICADIVAQIKSGLRYRDITIICGNVKDYFGILDVMMKRHDIPCRFSITRDILQTPCVKLILSALNIIIYNWKLADVLTYIKTGLCNITDEECDIIEEYATTWSLSGNVWLMDEDWCMNPKGYDSKISKDSLELLKRVNEIKDKITQPIILLSDKLKSNRKIENSVSALYEFLIGCIDPSALKGDDIASFNGIVEAFEQLSLCAGEEEIQNVESLKRLLKLICSQTTFNQLPSGVDEINVLGINSFRSAQAKRIYIIGANEGSYPCDYQEGNIIDERMRKALSDAELKLPHDPDEMYLEQNWLFYKAVLSAKQSVWLSRATGTLEGAEKVMCSSLAELLRCFPKLKRKSYDDYSIYDLIYDKASAFDRITDDKYGAALRDILSDRDEYKNAILSYDIPVSTDKCEIKLSENLEMLKGDMTMSQTKLESFVKCKFAYQMEYNLKLNEQAKVNYDPRDIGNFIHKILEEYLKASKDKKLTKKEQRDLVNKIVDTYIGDTCASISFVSKRMLSLFEKLRRNAHIFVRSISEEFEDSDFEPKFFEMSINNRADADLPPFNIELSDKSKVYINGQIDRVDAFEKDGKVYFRVIDYKTGKKEFSLSDLEKGINLQMFLYLFSIMENKEKFLKLLGCNGDLVPCATLYYLARINTETYDNPVDREILENEVISRIERKGAVLEDEDVINMMTKSNNAIILPAKMDLKKGKGALFTLESLGEIQNSINTVVKNIAESIKRGEADAIPNEELDPCAFCRMYGICRVRKEETADE